MTRGEPTRGRSRTRRRFLGALGTAAAVGLAGCLGIQVPGTGADDGTDSGDGSGSGADDGDAGAEQPEVGAVAETDLPVPRDDLIRAGLPESIPAIVDPAFADDWSGVETGQIEANGTERAARPRLSDSDPVIGVTRRGEARAYPLRVLTAHEVVNDEFDGPLLVTYCPVCASGVVARRVVDGDAALFNVTGLLWMNNLVMSDRGTDSLWSQIAATAIRGPQTGTTLRQFPSTVSTWEEWQEIHPDTEVLLPPPESGTLYQDTTDTVGSYTREEPGERSAASAEAFERGEFTFVLGLQRDGIARAYPIPVVYREGVVNDRVGDQPVVVAVGPGNVLVAYEARVDGNRLEFELADSQHVRADGSRFRIASGRAVDGPHEGKRLPRLNDVSRLFWRSWLDFHPDTAVYGGWEPDA